MKRVLIIFLASIFLYLAVSKSVAASEVTRVEDLIIEKFVSRSIGNTLDLIAFAPGSGWLRLITPDGLTPVISFNGVNSEEIEKFNRFSEKIGYPFRIKLEGKTLHIQHVRNRIISTKTRIDPRATRERNFFKFDNSPILAATKRKAGKIHLAKMKEYNHDEGSITLARQINRMRNRGFNLIQKSFSSHEESPSLDEVIELKNVKIRIVGSRSRFNIEALHYGPGVLGYATADNEITILGKRVGSKIIVNQAVLGHELNHLLNYSMADIANPDDLGEMGL